MEKALRQFSSHTATSSSPNALLALLAHVARVTRGGHFPQVLRSSAEGVARYCSTLYLSKGQAAFTRA